MTLKTLKYTHVKYLNVQNSHITDLHRNDPTYSGFARRLLASTAKRVNTAFARPHLVPGAGHPDTKDPHRFNPHHRDGRQLCRTFDPG